jgi:hypothetical protein
LLQNARLPHSKDWFAVAANRLPTSRLLVATAPDFSHYGRKLKWIFCVRSRNFAAAVAL